MHIHGDCFLGIAQIRQLPVIQHGAAIAQLPDRRHIVAYIQHRFALAAGLLAHLIQALALEKHIADRQDFIHDQDFAVQMRSHGKRQLYVHAAGIPLHRGIDELLNLRKRDDLVELRVDLAPAHAEYCAIHIDVFTACHLGVKARADLEHGGHPAVQIYLSAGGHGNAAQQFQQRAFPCAVPADYAKRFPGGDTQIDVVERKKALSGSGLFPDPQIGILFSPFTGPPALQFMLEGSAADLPQPVFLAKVANPDCRSAHFFCPLFCSRCFIAINISHR